MSQYPSLPLFTDAYIADTAHLTNEEHGAYLRLLMFAWRSPDCALPDDDVKLARMLGLTGKKWAALKDSVMSFWSLRDGRWVQSRLSRERQFVEEKIEKRRDAGKLGGRPKSLKDNEPVKANGSQEKSKPKAPTPTPNNPPSSSFENLDEWLRGLVQDQPLMLALDTHEIRALFDDGITNADIEAGIAAALKENFRARSWRQMVGWVRRAAQDRLAKAPRSSSAQSAAPTDPKKLDEGYRLMLRRYKEFPGTWPPKAGPRPGEAGCMIPAHILAEFNFHAARAA